MITYGQNDYSIPLKHRVIQENSQQTQGVSVGDKYTDVSFTIMQGETHHLLDVVKQGPAVFVFLSTECPVAQRYTMRLKRMNTEFSGEHVTIIGVYSNENDSVDDVKAYLEKAEFPFPVVKDTLGSLARHIGGTMTPQAHLIDTLGVLRYRGPIDDNRYETRVKHNYLKDALVAILDGKPVPVKAVPAFGCTIHFPDSPAVKQVTYTEHIAPILQKNCHTCHSQNGTAPVALVDYKNTKEHAHKIAEYTKARLMPLWKPLKGYGDFKNERRLTDVDIEKIQQWVKTGMEVGPEMVNTTKDKQPEEWILGNPDWVKELTMEYTKTHDFITIKTDFEEDLYVRAVDIQVESKINVQSIVVILGSNIIPHQVPKSDKISNKSVLVTRPKLNNNSTYFTWIPGVAPSVLPLGIGSLLPKNGVIRLHLSPQDTDYKNLNNQKRYNLQLGLYFTNTPEPARLRKITLTQNLKQDKPPTSYQFKNDVYVISTYPLRYESKKGLAIVAVTPTDEMIKMLAIKSSGIQWRENYYYKNPIFLAAGTRLEFVNIVDGDYQTNRELTDDLSDRIDCHFFYVYASENTPE